MKKNFLIYLPLISVLVLSTFAELKVNAQNYLITFAGKGASTAVSTVEVENLSSGTFLTLNGGDILRLTALVGISPVENENSSAMKIYPNPMIDNSIVEISPPASGDAIITVYEITGKPITQIQSYLENFRQEFRLSGLKNGIYLINVSGNAYQFSAKILCNGQADGILKIEKVNDPDGPLDEKKAKKSYKESPDTIEMHYTAGDKLKYTANSGNYSTIITDIPTRDKTLTFNFIPCIDGDNNSYEGVKIGSQIWMAENLKTTKYNDSTAIQLVTDESAWPVLSEAGYSWYNNDEATNKDTYGALYNWYAVNTGKLCPAGWHVPKEEEWIVLIDYLGGESEAGGKLKEAGTSHWYDPNTGATNETYFTGLPGGNRRNYGAFDYGGNGAFWWSSTRDSAYSAVIWYVDDDYSGIYKYWEEKGAYSVRCVIGDSEPTLTLTTTAESSVTDTTANFGGIIIDDAGSAVTARGVCWSTSPNPTLSDSITTDGDGIGAFKSFISGLKLFTTYYVRAYAINSLGTAYGNEISFTSGIGMSYQGGIMAYALNPWDPGYIEGETHGLIAAPSDQSTGIQWYDGRDTTRINTDAGLGTGNANTDAIVASQGEGNYAAKLCYDLVLGGYSDWYLPSEDELMMLYLNKEAIGGFASEYYWSSSDSGDGIVMVQTFYNGAQHGGYKDYNYHVRAVRSF